MLHRALLLVLGLATSACATTQSPAAASDVQQAVAEAAINLELPVAIGVTTLSYRQDPEFAAELSDQLAVALSESGHFSKVVRPTAEQVMVERSKLLPAPHNPEQAIIEAEMGRNGLIVRGRVLVNDRDCLMVAPQQGRDDNPCLLVSVAIVDLHGEEVVRSGKVAWTPTTEPEHADDASEPSNESEISQTLALKDVVDQIVEMAVAAE